MITPGSFQRLEVTASRERGWLLGDDGVFLPDPEHRLEGVALGEQLEVFVYADVHDRLIASRRQPYARVGECAYLKAVACTPHGAFLDWGLEKDLLVPTRQQMQRMAVGRSYVVAVTCDEHGRVWASARLHDHLSDQPGGLRVGQAVDFLVYEGHARGHRVVVDHRFKGMVYSSDDFGGLRIGDRGRGFVTTIREDGKLDISLRARGVSGLEDGKERLRAALQAAGGFLALNDASDPEVIRAEIGLSKKAFKRALGMLFKAREIAFEGDGIRWLRDDRSPEA